MHRDCFDTWTLIAETFVVEITLDDIAEQAGTATDWTIGRMLIIPVSIVTREIKYYSELGR